ncbi:MAG: hypothetical protein R2758_06040 [Bacteroidales bacterium]
MSLVDKLLGIDGEVFKLIYTSFTGLSLLVSPLQGSGSVTGHGTTAEKDNYHL